MRNNIIAITGSTVANYCARLVSVRVIDVVTFLTYLCGAAQFLFGWLNGSWVMREAVVMQLHHKQQAVPGMRRVTKTTLKDFGSFRSALSVAAFSRF